jgi:hypothetical protein
MIGPERLDASFSDSLVTAGSSTAPALEVRSTEPGCRTAGEAFYLISRRMRPASAAEFETSPPADPGLWEEDTCCLVTTDANAVAAPEQDRMDEGHDERITP